MNVFSCVAFEEMGCNIDVRNGSCIQLRDGRPRRVYAH